MFNKLSINAKIGLIMEAIAGISMGILVLLDKPIPDLIAWVFFAGIIIAIVPDLLRSKK